MDRENPGVDIFTQFGESSMHSWNKRNASESEITMMENSFSAEELVVQALKTDVGRQLLSSQAEKHFKLEVTEACYGSIIIRFSPKGENSLQKVKQSCATGSIKDFVPNIFMGSGAENSLGEGDFRWKFTIYITPYRHGGNSKLAAIKNHWKLLVEEMNPRTLLADLQAKGLVGKEDEDEMLKLDSRKERMKFLLKRLLASKEPDLIYEVLLEHCQKCNEYVYQRILETEGGLPTFYGHEELSAMADKTSETERESHSDQDMIYTTLLILNIRRKQSLQTARHPGPDSEFEISHLEIHEPVCYFDLEAEVHKEEGDVADFQNEVVMVLEQVQEPLTDQASDGKAEAHKEEGDAADLQNEVAMVLEQVQEPLTDQASVGKGKLHRNVLNRCLPVLLEDVDFASVSMYIQQKDIFESVTLRDILEQPTTSEKIGELIKQIQLKDQDIYEKFKECLVQAKQESLKVMLEEEEAKFAEEIKGHTSDRSKVMAGIENKNLVLALELEKASTFCHVKKMVDGEGMASFNPDTKYIVVDLGGGTVDITAHEVMAGGKLKEIHTAAGGAWGGTQVDEAFMQFLISLVGSPVFHRFQTESKEDYLDIIRDFEIKKRDIAPGNDRKVTFHLPSSLKEIFQQETDEDLQNAIKQTRYADKVSLTSDKLRLDDSKMKSFFSNAIQNTVSHVKELLKASRNQRLSSILMVGGFSESKKIHFAKGQSRRTIKVSLSGDKLHLDDSIMKASGVQGLTSILRCCKMFQGTVKSNFLDVKAIVRQEAGLEVPGTKYMNQDFGGGTVDITVHEVKFGGNLKEVHKASVGAFGANWVNGVFMQSMNSVFRNSVLHRFQTKCK